MPSSGRYQNPVHVVRGLLAAATVAFGVLGVVLPDGRLLAASGAFGLIWTLWDLLWEHVFGPSVDWAIGLLSGGAGGPPVETRPTLEDTIRLLESHLAGDSARSVKIQAAIRLEEIYRMGKQPHRAHEVIDRIRALYPDAPELPRLQDRRQDG